MSELIEFLKTIVLSLGILGIAIAVLGAAWISAISRNPEGSDKMFVPGIIVLSCIEVVNISLIGLVLLNLSKI